MSTSYDDARQKTGEVMDQAQEKVGQVKEQVSQQATSQISTQKDKAAEGLQNVAHMLRYTGDQMKQNNQATPLSQVADQAAGQVEKFSNYLRQNDLSQIVRGVEDFGRREPALFLGGAFALGLLASRFFRSSASSSQGNRYGSQYGSQGYSQQGQDAYRYGDMGTGDQRMGYRGYESYAGSQDIDSRSYATNVYGGTTGTGGAYSGTTSASDTYAPATGYSGSSAGTSAFDRGDTLDLGRNEPASGYTASDTPSTGFATTDTTSGTDYGTTGTDYDSSGTSGTYRGDNYDQNRGR